MTFFSFECIHDVRDGDRRAPLGGFIICSEFNSTLRTRLLRVIYYLNLTERIIGVSGVHF